MSFAVIGRSEGAPTLYHMNQTQANAERLRQRREATTGQPCFVTPMADWTAGPRSALQRAETNRFAQAAPVDRRPRQPAPLASSAPPPAQAQQQSDGSSDDTVEDGTEYREYRELRRRMDAAGLLEPQPRSYAIRLLATAVLLAASLAFLVAFHGPVGIIIGALFLSVVSVQIAFLAHDAGHRQGFVRRWQNALVGVVLTDFLLGASYGWWVHKHNAHHAHPNHEDMDPDIELPLIAFTSGQALEKRGVSRWVAKHQLFFALPLLTLVSYGQRIGSIRFLIEERSRYRRWEIAAVFLNAVLYIGTPLVLLGPWSTLLLILIHQGCTGLYLGLVFAPNHKGMAMVDTDAPMDALRSQVLTARNVQPHPVTDWCYGGLNYQIEHHLFPALSRNRLRAAQKIIRGFCRERGVSYHETSVLRSYVEIANSLRDAAAPLRTRPALASPVTPAQRDAA